MMTKDELSLLLYLESCSVDQSGKLNHARMNDADRDILKRWETDRYIAFGRIPFQKIIDRGALGTDTMWVLLSEKAWADAHAERRARALRNQKYPSPIAVVG